MQINKFAYLLFQSPNLNKISTNIKLCSRTTRQMAADHQWSADHRLRTAALWNVTRATLVSKLVYASPAWFGFLDESSKTRCQGIIKKLIRTGYLGEGFASFAELCGDADEKLFRNIQTNNHHVLHQLLPPIKNSQHALRPRVHQYQIPFAKNNALRNNYMYRMLYKDIY